MRETRIEWIGKPNHHTPEILGRNPPNLYKQPLFCPVTMTTAIIKRSFRAVKEDIAAISRSLQDWTFHTQWKTHDLERRLERVEERLRQLETIMLRKEE